MAIGPSAEMTADVKYRDLMKQLKADGWVIVAIRSPNDDIHPRTMKSCIATGATRDETVERMREAIALHIEGLRADGEAIPEPVTSAELVAA
jgi:predicted RNase H-like HicB family nuclease